MGIIDGKKISSEIREEIAVEVASLAERGVYVGLAVILVGSNPASQVYVRNKISACEKVGIRSFAYYLPEDATEEQVVELVDTLAADQNVDGILVQLPLPRHIDEKHVCSHIPIEKDVDGFLPENVGNLVIGNDTLKCCTPYGVIELLKRSGVEIAGKHAVVVGRSNIVGKPLAMLLLAENATVTVCHSKTRDLASITRQADILCVAIGRAKFITEDMVKDGAVVIDVGMNREEGKLCGDVDYDAVSKKAALITPVPGGVGPMTITMLLKNTLKTASKKG